MFYASGFVPFTCIEKYWICAPILCRDDSFVHYLCASSWAEDWSGIFFVEFLSGDSENLSRGEGEVIELGECRAWCLNHETYFCVCVCVCV